MLALTMDSVNKIYGSGTIMKMSDTPHECIDCFPSGNILLDLALKVGGLPKGRIVEIFGSESSGKTTIALQAIASVQKAGGTAVFIDTEYAFDPLYASKIGVNTEELLICQPNDGEEAFDVCEALVRSGAVEIIVIDSVSAIVPRAEIEGSMEECPVGLLSRLMGQALRKLTAILNHTNCVILFVNQMRYDIRTGKEKATGGSALKYFSSLRLEVRRGESIVSNNIVIGKKVTIRVVKNKVGSPFGECTLDLIFGEGILCEKEMLQAALEKKFIQRSGRYYYYIGERIAQCESDAIRYLIDNHDVYEELDELIHKGYISRLIEEQTTDDEDDEEIRRLHEIELMYSDL